MCVVEREPSGLCKARARVARKIMMCEVTDNVGTATLTRGHNYVVSRSFTFLLSGAGGPDQVSPRAALPSRPHIHLTRDGSRSALVHTSRDDPPTAQRTLSRRVLQRAPLGATRDRCACPSQTQSHQSHTAHTHTPLTPTYRTHTHARAHVKQVPHIDPASQAGASLTMRHGGGAPTCTMPTLTCLPSSW